MTLLWKLAEQFLDESASQLTYHGICELNAVIKEGELAVFFRNNHFSTIVKMGGVLYLLVTDQGYLHQGDVVWESLDSVQGDTVFVDQQFNIVTSGGEAAWAGAGGQDRDHQLAVSLQKQDAEAVSQDREWAEFEQRHMGTGQEEAGSLNKFIEVSKVGLPVEMGTLSVHHVQKKISLEYFQAGTTVFAKRSVPIPSVQEPTSPQPEKGVRRSGRKRVATFKYAAAASKKKKESLTTFNLEDFANKLRQWTTEEGSNMKVTSSREIIHELCKILYR